MFPAPGSPEEAARFAQLQARLAEQYLRFRSDMRQQYSVVVVPSVSVDQKELLKIQGVAHYEERFLFHLMLLRRPRLQIVYVTSKRIDPLIIDYYLHQVRGVPAEHARRRLTLLDCDDASPRPLTQKILERPTVMDRISAAVPDPRMAHLSTYNSTVLERTLAVRLGLPIYGPSPELRHFGSKTGSRRVLAEAGVRIPPGREDLRSIPELVDAIHELRREHPRARKVAVKLDDSFGGAGNGTLDLLRLSTKSRIADALPSIELEAPDIGWEQYAEQFQKMGGVCEVWIEGEGKASPSAQLRINPLGEVQVVSTHDQVLGGRTGATYRGALFPADARYRLQIQELGSRVGQILAREGVIGRFAVDFIAVPKTNGDLDLYGCEINLRHGGTTHPFNTLKSLTDGNYDEKDGLFRTAQGMTRSYFATDNLRSPKYRGILPFDLIDLLVVNGIHFRSDDTGVVFHLLGCLSEYGKLGCTCVAPTIRQAQELYRHTVSLLDEMAEQLSPKPAEEALGQGSAAELAGTTTLHGEL
jgi:hypothetical protein